MNESQRITPSMPDMDGGISPYRIGAALLRAWRWVLVLPTATALLALVALLVLPPSYTAVASFVPTSADASMSRLAGLAAQFGVPVGMSAAGVSPDFYAELLRSRTILEPTLRRQYVVPAPTRFFGLFGGDTLRGDLVALLEHDKGDAAKDFEETLEELAELLNAEVLLTSGQVRVSMATRYPSLSLDVVKEVLSQTQAFDIERRQTQASAEREFVEERLASFEKDLLAAEAGLMRFLTDNRQFQSSPTLMFEHDRLQREVALRHTLYSSTFQSYEQARVEEVRNTPVITIVETPFVPGRADRRKALVKAAAVAVLVGMGAVLLVLVGQIMRETRSARSEDHAEFVAARAETFGRLRSLRQRIVGRGKG